MRRALRGRLVAALLLAVRLRPGDSAADLVPGPGPGEDRRRHPELRELKDAAGVEDCAPGDGRPVDGGLPDVTLPCLGGGRDVDLSSLRGPLVRQPLGVLVRAVPHGDAGPPGLPRAVRRPGRVLGIDYEDPQTGAAMELRRATGRDLPAARRPAERAPGQGAVPGPDGLPFFALVDADGEVAHRSAGGVDVRRRAGRPGRRAPRGRPVSAATGVELPDWLRPVQDGGRVDHRRTS